MADALDSKSGVSDGVRVRVPPPVPIEFKALAKIICKCLFCVLLNFGSVTLSGSFNPLCRGMALPLLLWLRA